MNLLFINIPFLIEKDNQIIKHSMENFNVVGSYSLYLLSSVVYKEGFQWDILDLSGEDKIDIDKIKNQALKYHVLLFSANSLNWAGVKIIMEEIKKENKEIPVILGGIHPSFFDEYILRTTPADFIIRGEGEKPLVQLLKWLRKRKGSPSGISGLSYKDKDKIIRNKNSKLLTELELEHLPFPSFQKMPPDRYLSIPLETSRGCPFHCPFCSILHHGSWRAVSPYQIYERLHKCVEFLPKTKMKYISFVDDYFTPSIKRIYDLAKILDKKKEKFSVYFNSRCSDLIEDEWLEYVKPWTVRIFMGGECGYNKGLMKLQKGFTIKTIEDSARLLLKRGMSGVGEYSFLIGFPWESKKEIIKTIDFSAHLVREYGITARLSWHELWPPSRFWMDEYNKGSLDIGWYDSLSLYRNPSLKSLACPYLAPDDIEEIEQYLYKTFSNINYRISSNTSDSSDYFPATPSPEGGFYYFNREMKEFIP